MNGLINSYRWHSLIGSFIVSVFSTGNQHVVNKIRLHILSWEQLLPWEEIYGGSVGSILQRNQAQALLRGTIGQE